MISPKLLLSMMVLAGTQSAPQISERQVVGDVIAQLGPAISQAVSSLTGGGSPGSSSFSAGNRGVGSSSFSSGGFSAPSQFSQAPQAPRFNPAPTSATLNSFSPSTFSSSAPRSSLPSSSSSVTSLTGSVVSSLQPAIARAVAQALGQSNRAQTQPRIQEQQVNFVPVNVPQPSRSSGLSESDIISKILATISPSINSAVQSALSSQPQPQRVQPRIQAQPVFQSQSQAFRSQGHQGSQGGQDSSSIIQSVIASLQPAIGSAVSSAITATGPQTRTAQHSANQVPHGQGQGYGSSGLSSVFGVPGQQSVKFDTPYLNVNY